MGRIYRDDIFDEGIEEWLKSTDQLIHGVPAPDKEKRVDVWLNERYLETIEDARKVYGGTTATVVRVALELLREKMGLDSIVPHIPEGDD
jgi:hypothetical protein